MTKRSSIVKMVAMSLAVLGLEACTDYVDKYESDFKEAYGNEEVFKANLDKADWEWASICDTGDWFWCAIQDGKFVSEAQTGANWEQFSSGSARLSFAGKDGRAYDFTTDILPEDLTPFIRLNGGISIKLENASKGSNAGVGISLDGFKADENSAIVLAYGNEYPGAKLCLRDVVKDGVNSEWCWTLEQGGVTAQTFDYKDLKYSMGEEDLDTFIGNVDYVAVVLTEDVEVKNGLTVVAVGFSGKGLAASSSSNAAKPSSSSSVKPSSSAESGSENTSGFLWKGSDKSNVVKTDVGSAKWTTKLDDTDGGSTAIIEPQGNPYDTCNGLCGLVKYGGAEGNVVYPWAQVLFDLDSKGGTHDVSSWEGLCIAFNMDKEATLLLQPADASDYGFNVPAVKLLTPETGKQYRVQNFKWEDFEQESGWGNENKITGGEVAKALKSIAIQFNGNPYQSHFFNIYQIGSYGRCNVPPDTVEAKDIGVDYFKELSKVSALDYLNPDIKYDSVQDSRDGKWYRTIEKGGLTWMAQNLNYESEGSYCYDDKEDYCDKFGRLYKRNVALNACPSGWRLARKADWDSVWGPYASIAGNSLKSMVGWSEIREDQYNAGFSAVAAGYRKDTGEYISKEDYAFFWSSSVNEDGKPYYVYLAYDSDAATVGNVSRGSEIALSVRCVKQEVDNEGCEDTDLWCKNTSYRVKTGIDAGSGNSGYWKVEIDQEEGGESVVEWPVEYNAREEFSAVVDYCKGLCGTVKLARGEMPDGYNPWVMLTFDIAGSPDGSDNKVPVDVSGWGGLCITYTSDSSAMLEMDFDLLKNSYLWYNKPFVELSASKTERRQCFEWTEFQQLDLGGKVLSGPDGAKSLHSIDIKFRAPKGSPNFNIIRLEKYKKAGKATLSTFGMIKDLRDNNYYRTVEIADLVWMRDNLRFKTSNAVYFNGDDKYKDLGYFYNITEALNACPEGWRIPTNDEWRKAIKASGGDPNSISAGKMMDTLDMHDNSGYYWGNQGKWYTDGVAFWSSTEKEADVYVVPYFGNGTYNGTNSTGGLSDLNNVRCVRKEWYSPLTNSFKDERDGQVYKTVVVNGKVWMGENLKYQTGEAIFYRDSASYSDRGYYYTYTEVKDACPAGWQLPTKSEWEAAVNSAVSIKAFVDTMGIVDGQGYYMYANRNQENQGWYEEGTTFWSSSPLNSGHMTPYFSGFAYYRDDTYSGNADRNLARCIMK